MKQIIVKSRLATEQMPAYTVPWACISIVSPNQRSADIKKENSVGLLRLRFDDIIEPRPPMYTALFTYDHARRILDFAFKIWDAADILHVHCEAGISRSAGVAAALSEIYFGNGDEFMNPPYWHNPLVYQMILTVHRKRMMK